jgi:hypothetical protein
VCHVVLKDLIDGLTPGLRCMVGGDFLMPMLWFDHGARSLALLSLDGVYGIFWS